MGGGRDEAKRRILIVEDDPDQRFLEKAHLEASGYTVIESGDAKDGIARALNEKPDVIIMDVRLPYKKKGIGAAKIIRKSESGKNVPIIFVTAYSAWEESEEVKNISKSAYLVKPYDSAVLIRYIEDLLEQTD